MDVWITRCRKRGVCGYCEKLIISGDPMVVCKFWNRSKEDKRFRWPLKKRFHPQCWLTQGIEALGKREIVETRGRKKVLLTESETRTKAERVKVLRDRAAIIQRMKRETSKPQSEQNIDRIVYLGAKLWGLRQKIEQLGGVPKSWE